APSRRAALTASRSRATVTSVFTGQQLRSASRSRSSLYVWGAVPVPSSEIPDGRLGLVPPKLLWLPVRPSAVTTGTWAGTRNIPAPRRALPAHFAETRKNASRWLLPPLVGPRGPCFYPYRFLASDRVLTYEFEC